MKGLRRRFREQEQSTRRICSGTRRVQMIESFRWGFDQGWNAGFASGILISSVAVLTYWVLS